jgi:IS5 family transposase
LLLAQAGQHALVARTLADHAELRRLAEALATPDADSLLRFADLLGAHVRFEEREVFEAAQASLDTHTV